MKQELIDAYGAIGVTAGRTVIIHSDFARLASFGGLDKQAVLDAHYQAFRDLVGPEGTLAVIAGSQNLCNTETPFDVANTPSWQMGIFTEHLRKQPGTLRSFHPFISFAANGPMAATITQDVSRHAWGPETPTQRLIDLDALCVSIGIHPRFTCSTVHHVEQAMGAPYRYSKEYMHPVIRDGNISVEPFYTYVYYLACEIDRNRNKKIFKRFMNHHSVSEHPLRNGKIYSYAVKDFYASAVQSMKDDIYVWLNQPPKTRPYRT